MLVVAEDDVQQEEDGVVDQNGGSPEKSNGGASDIANGVKKMGIKEEEKDNGRSCTGRVTIRGIINGVQLACYTATQQLGPSAGQLCWVHAFFYFNLSA
jgi:hypothetical protein